MDKFKYNPLFLATTYGHDEAVNILLQNNHALNLESGQKEMYLMLTNLEGPDGVINKYFDELASLPGTLHWAVAFCSKSIVERLLDSGADIEEKGAHENTSLHTAASFGNKEVVELLIDRGAQIDPLDKYESTPLHWAVSHCHLEIIQLLLDKGANKRYALSWAASGRNLNIVKLLVENGCDVNESDNDTAYSHTPLMWAAICGQAEIIEYLIENGAEIINTIINFDIIHWCATNGLVDTIKMLVERGVDVNELDLCFSRTPLHCAAIVGNVEVIKYLLSVQGIDVNAEEDNCDLPIKYAVNGNHHEVMKMLIEHGADINNEDGYMGIPVLIAAENGNLKTLEILIDSGVNLNPEDSSPLAVAVSNGHFHMIDYLLEKGADRREFIHSLAKMGTVNDLLKYMKPGEVHALDLYNKQTPLFYALHNVSNVKFLIENGADVNHRDNENKTPLYLAIDYENLDCVRILVNNGANVNDKINDITPLMLAKQKANLDIVEFLKDYCKANSSGFDGDDNLGSDNYELHYLSYHGLMDHITKLTNIEKYINEKDAKGCTPLHLACAQNHTQVVKYLINLGADVNCQDQNLSTALHWAVYNNNIELVKVLIERNADVQIQDSNGIQPIHLAALKGHIEIINILTPMGKSDEITDKQGITPLHLASHCGHNDVIRALLETGYFNVNATDKNAIRPLHLAIGSNHDTTAKLLLEKGALSSCFDSYGRSPMHWAAVNGNLEAIKSLSFDSESMTQNRLDTFKCNPLFLATFYGHDKAVNILLQNNHALNLESGQREMYLMLTNLEGPDGVINKYFDELENTYSLPNTLHWAAAFCSKTIVERLLDSGADIEEKGAHENTSLHTAASFGNQDVVELLIDRGAQLDPLDKDESTPLHWAVAHCHLEVIQLLLDKGASEENALCWAAACGNLNIVKLLIENDCDVNEEDGDEEYTRTPLIWAATCGHPEIFEYLLNEVGAEITNYDVLHWCASNGLLDSLKMLIERGIDVNELDLCYKWTALHWAAIAGNVDITKFLLNVDGIRVSGSSFKRNSPLHYAVLHNHNEIIKMLIEHGADIDECADLGIPLHMAVEAGNLETVKILVEGGADLTICFVDLPLNLAVQFGYMDIVEYLFEKCTEKQDFIHNLAEYRTVTDILKYMKPEDVNALENYERTPLFYAILGNDDNVKFFIENGADVNHKDEQDRTPLYVAIENGKLECVQVLIENGADINTKMPEHPIMLAIETSNLDILKLLIDKYNADINIVSDNLWSPLHHAANIPDNDAKKLKIIEYLLSRNVDVNARDCQGSTALYLAMYSVLPDFGHFVLNSDEFSSDIILLLLNNGAEINIKTCQGRTTLSLPVSEGNIAYVKLLILHGADVNLDPKIKTCCTKKNDIPILRLLYNAGLNLTNIAQNDRAIFDSDVESFITYAETNPLSLKQLCRITCRNTFGKNYFNIIKCLLLPITLKKYLLFDELKIFFPEIMDGNMKFLQSDILHILSHEGRIDEITKISLVEKLINEINWEGCTPLHYACAQNHTQVAEYLISLGADVNCQDKNLSTALHWAVYNNNIELVKVLIERNADVQIQDSNGIQPIHLAALKGHIEIINILAPMGKSGEITDKQGITPLHLASHCGHNDVIRALLETGYFNVNATDKNAIRPLHLAIGSNHDTTAKLLLEKGALSSCFDSYGRSPMHWAAVNGSLEAIKSLSFDSESMTQNRLDTFNCNPLFLATFCGHDEAVKFLLQNNHALNLESGQREMYLMLSNLKGPDGVINKYFDELVSLPGTLHWAVAFCSKSIVERLLDSGADIEEKGGHENTPLHTAASFGNKDVVELLIEKGAQLDPLDKDESTPLHWAVAHCHLEVIQLLLDKGASKENALCWAAACGNLNIVKLLIESGCDVNEEDGDKEYTRTPLIWAATCGHANILEYLLVEAGVAITNYDILHWCVFNGLLDTIQILIEHGIEVNEPDVLFGRTALHWAAIVGNINVIKYLLSVDGIDVNVYDHGQLGDLPIHYAVDRSHFEIVKILIESGAYIDRVGNLGLPILMAIEAEKLEILKMFIESGVDLDACYYYPETMRSYGSPLRLAVRLGHMDIANYLLGKNCESKVFIHNLAEYRTVTDLKKYMKPEDINALDYDGRTPLFYAILGNDDNVKFLIESGADVNHKDESNQTPLFVAIEKEKFECVQVLINNGADVNIKMCRHGITPIMHAIQNSNLDILKFLIDKCKADIDIFDNNSWSPLHHAANIPDNDDKKLKIIEYLFSKNVDVNITNCRGCTPFYLSILSLYEINSYFYIDNEDSVEIIELLLENDAEINVKTCNGFTPLSIVVREKDDEHIKLLILHGADVNLDPKIKTYCTKENDIPILELLYNAGLNLTNIPQSDREKFDPDVQSFITYAETNPLNLKQLCRISCRNTFGKNYLKIVRSLLLPNGVNKFLLFDQL
ncbi:uncharacterized protein LOC123300452 [Chrysoperla carnea]|uniref:uncharacterized protein LOC123300452 n=1 Tax=Chrysoperla carnea TaxID=189513 RepID=UPI001D092442|nr:uncharacterized protein LOC123300452 [Chrysoperla carnea]